MSSFAHGAYSKPKRFYLQGLSTTISDIGSTRGSEVSKGFPTKLTEAELGLRIMGVFSIAAIGQQSSDDSLTGYGIGARIDLPGFFFIGGQQTDFLKKSKGYPLNTSIFMQTISTNLKQDTAVTKTIASRYGVSIDLFPFQTALSLTLETGLYNFAGNSFFLYGFGLGLQF